MLREFEVTLSDQVPAPSDFDADPLRRYAETFQALIEDSPFGAYAVDADLRVLHASKDARRGFASVTPFIGRDLAEALRIVWPEPFASEVLAHFQHTLATGEPYVARGTVQRRADIDAVEAYDWRLERISLPDETYGVVCYYYDFSERFLWEQTTAAERGQARARPGRGPDWLVGLEHRLGHPRVVGAVQGAV